MRIALTGNPNSGKTTMFNALTGSSERVGNWSGVTVDKKERSVKKSISGYNGELVAIDLPGAYSMSPFTGEERIASDYVSEERPDVIVNIVDATNLSRSLFFTTQLLELGIPVVVALNKSDINRKRKTEIDKKLLSESLFCRVVETVSTNDEGLSELIKTAVSVVGKAQKAPFTQNTDLRDKEAVRKADALRFEFVNKIVSRVEKRQIKANKRNLRDRIDTVLTGKILGLPIFAAVMFCVFDISQRTFGPLVADMLTGYLERFRELVRIWISGAGDIARALLADGIIGGFIAVVGFLPLVMVMYFLIALLEDCGYMARVSVVLDPIFKKVGLSGRSVIPFIVGTGCAVPGIMACRTIRSERERRATAMLAPFMPCGAKLPVISLFAGAFFGKASWIGALMYFAGIAIIFFGALLINRITGNYAKRSYFIIELPEYKFPSIWRALTSSCARGRSYIVKAGTVILLCNIAVHIMQTFDLSLKIAEGADSSILASIAGPIAYALVPIVGVVSWQLAAAAITGFIAKENVVGTLAVCFAGLHNLIDAEELQMMSGAGGEVAGVLAITKSAALAYLMFNLFSPPCVAALAAMGSEMKSAKWTLAGIGFHLAVGYTVAFAVYQLGTLVTTGSFGAGFGYGICPVVLFAAIIGFLIRRADKKAFAVRRIGERV